MGKRDYYRVLGVDKRADPSKIRKAYRKAAKRYHPDISSKGGEKFREVNEAYETLSNPEKRERYDRQTLNKPRPTSNAPHLHETFDSTIALHDELDELFQRFDRFWLGDFQELLDGGTRSDDRLFLEIILTPEEAMRGGQLPLTLPLWKTCERCGGTGSRDGLICGSCRGQKRTKLLKNVSLEIPPEIKGDKELTVALDEIGLPKTNLFVTIRIQRD